jgi:NHL repeat
MLKLNLALVAAICCLAGCSAHGVGNATDALSPDDSALRPPAGTGIVYVSDPGSDRVTAYYQENSKRRWRPFEKITNLDRPQGIAVDDTGNLYVAEGANLQVLVYPPGSTTPSLTIGDPTGYPLGIAVESGHLYVANLYTPNFQPGNLVSFNTDGTGYRSFTCDLTSYFFVAVDPGGDVFVDGLDANAAPAIREIPRKKQNCRPIPPTLASPGGLAIDAAGDLVVDDRSGALKAYAPPDYSTLVSTTTLTGVTEPIAFAFQQGEDFVWTADVGSSSVTQFAYPAGGSPTGTLNGELAQPLSVATYPVDSHGLH